jgi:hypothetical protein
MFTRTIPVIIAAVTGIVLVLAHFVPEIRWAVLSDVGPPPVPEERSINPQRWGEIVSTWFTVLAAMAYVLGAANLVRLHLKKVSDQSAGWGYSAVTLVSFFLMLTLGLFKVGCFPPPPPPAGAPADPARESAAETQIQPTAWAGDVAQQGTAFWFVFEYAMRPLMSTMFALLAFFVASAAFRAFRAKNIEATLLLATAFIVFLGRTYTGIYLTAWLPDSLSELRLDSIVVTIMQVFNTAGNRAIMIGIALGVVATSMRIILTMDRSYLGGGGS